MTEIKKSEIKHHTVVDPHKYSNPLANIILGGQDGLVNVLGIVLGVAAATHDPKIVIIAGLSATFAESVSMAAVAFTTMLAETAHYESEKEREMRHIEEAPSVERDEIRRIYLEKGFEGDLLDQIVEKITSNKNVWVDVMMMEEHSLVYSTRKDAYKAALIVGIAAIIGSLIPLFPFFFYNVTLSIWISLVISAVSLFLVGIYKAISTVGKPVKSGLEMTVIGIVSALFGYLVGIILKVE